MQMKRQNSILSKLSGNLLIQSKKQNSQLQAQIKEELDKESFSSSDFSS